MKVRDQNLNLELTSEVNLNMKKACKVDKSGIKVRRTQIKSNLFIENEWKEFKSTLNRKIRQPFPNFLKFFLEQFKFERSLFWL